MGKILKLTNFSVKLNFSFLSSRYKSKWNIDKILLLSAILCGAACIMGYYTNLINEIYSFFNNNGMKECLNPAFLIGAESLILISGLFFAINIFYYSKDYEALIYLPYKPSTILMSKLFTVMIYEWVIELLILAPVFIVYGINSAAGVFYWIECIVTLVLNPVMPVAALGLYVIMLMRLFQNKKYKDFLGIVCITVFFIVLGIVGIFASYVKLPLKSIRQCMENIIDRLLMFLPNVKIISKILSGPKYSLAFTMLLLVLSGISILIFMRSADILYENGIYTQQINNLMKKKKMKKLVFKSKSQLMSCFCKEYNTFFRITAYIVNGLIGIVITPFLIPLAFQTNGIGGDINQIKILISSHKFSPLATIIALAVVAITSGINVVASSCISREGRNAWICKIIPVSAKTQIWAKILFSVFVSVIGVLLNCIIFIFYFGYTLQRAILIFSIGSLFIIAWTLIGTFVDLTKPKLNWVNESEAVKQNINILLSMLVSFCILILYYIFLKYAAAHCWSEVTIYGFIIVTLLGLIILCYKGVISFSRKFFNNG